MHQIHVRCIRFTKLASDGYFVTFSLSCQSVASAACKVETRPSSLKKYSNVFRVERRHFA